ELGMGSGLLKKGVSEIKGWWGGPLAPPPALEPPKMPAPKANGSGEPIAPKVEPTLDPPALARALGDRWKAVRPVFDKLQNGQKMPLEDFLKEVGSPEILDHPAVKS